MTTNDLPFAQSHSPRGDRLSDGWESSPFWGDIFSCFLSFLSAFFCGLILSFFLFVWFSLLLCAYLLVLFLFLVCLSLLSLSLSFIHSHSLNQSIFLSIYFYLHLYLSFGQSPIITFLRKQAFNADFFFRRQRNCQAEENRYAFSLFFFFSFRPFLTRFLHPPNWFGKRVIGYPITCASFSHVI